jgi:type II secretory pathway component PulC
MERIIFIAGCALLILIVGAVALFFVFNPMERHRVALAAELGKIQPEDVPFPKPSRDYEKWVQQIAGKPNLWKELVEAPPPPEPVKPPDPKLEEMLKGVTIGRQQIGSKVKIMKPDDQRGQFYTVGDTINGCTIKEISKTDVTFSLTFEGKELLYKMQRGGPGR